MQRHAYCHTLLQHFEARAKDLEEQLEAEKLRVQQLEAELSDLQVEVRGGAVVNEQR